MLGAGRKRDVALPLLVAGLLASSCVGGSLPMRLSDGRGGERIDRIALDLHGRSRGLTANHRDTYDGLLVDHLAKDAYRGTPGVQQVFAPPRGPEERVRRLHGPMPHYGVYYGPMRYRIRAARRADGGAGWAWQVEVHVAVTAPDAPDAVMELPDCELRDELEGPVHCEGIPYPDAPGTEACPESGRFEARASRHNLRALLAHWSTVAEHYYNRDAEYFALPVQYDFEYFLADDAARAAEPVDLRMPLWLSCGRTPYFLAMRTGWSAPIVAHETGHFMGLLDEYEMLSGMSSLYPKTPFAGAEQSRMGLSMKRDTRVLPLHHYLVLRRYHCAEPEARDPYLGLLRSP